jgi:hypothetical protein
LLRPLVWLVAATAAVSAVEYALRLGHRLGGVERAL